MDRLSDPSLRNGYCFCASSGGSRRAGRKSRKGGSAQLHGSVLGVAKFKFYVLFNHAVNLADLSRLILDMQRLLLNDADRSILFCRCSGRWRSPLIAASSNLRDPSVSPPAPVPLSPAPTRCRCYSAGICTISSVRRLRWPTGSAGLQCKFEAPPTKWRQAASPRRVSAARPHLVAPANFLLIRRRSSCHFLARRGCSPLTTYAASSLPSS